MQYGEGALCSSAGRAETHRLGEGVLGSWDLSVLALVSDGDQGLGPPAAGVALRCYQQWEPGVGERQGFLQAPSFAVIMAKHPLETALGGRPRSGEGAVATEKEWWVLVCPEHPPPSARWRQEQGGMVHPLGRRCLERSRGPRSHPQSTACSPTILSPSGQASSASASCATLLSLHSHQLCWCC